MFDTGDISLKVEVECLEKCRRGVFCWDIPGGVVSGDVDLVGMLDYLSWDTLVGDCHNLIPTFFSSAYINL